MRESLDDMKIMLRRERWNARLSEMELRREIAENLVSP